MPIGVEMATSDWENPQKNTKSFSDDGEDSMNKAAVLIHGYGEALVSRDKSGKEIFNVPTMPCPKWKFYLMRLMFWKYKEILKGILILRS